MIQPPTYPARPLNGGALDVALPKRGDWRAEPKYNGWRALVHVPTGVMFNRKLERLSIENEFATALAELRARIRFDTWADCEALERRHNMARGTLIVLDLIIPGTYLERRGTLSRSLLQCAIGQRIEPDSIYLTPSYENAKQTWERAQKANLSLHCDFYEGIVCKRADRPYPIQRISATRETADWIKHRWRA